MRSLERGPPAAGAGQPSVSDTNDPVDFADFASRNEDRIAPETVRMLEPTDLVQLPKGEAFALIHGGQLLEPIYDAQLRSIRDLHGIGV